MDERPTLLARSLRVIGAFAEVFLILLAGALFARWMSGAAGLDSYRGCVREGALEGASRKL